jgi:photolyase PhrII
MAPGPDTDELLQELPLHLRERTRALEPARRSPRAEFVLCWLHHAVRDHENPAVDAAIHLANHIGLPVVVYQGLGGRHRYNSDRSDNFILEGARDAHRGLAARGVRTLFWLPDDPSDPSPLHELARRAAAVVVEDFPAPPMPRWTRAMADGADAPVFAVDCACLVPMQSVEGRHTRAFRFRKAIEDRLKAALGEPWPDAPPPEHALPDGLDPGFASLDVGALGDDEIDAAIARRAVDHTIAPARWLPGGSSAGYQRWGAFRRNRLSAYHRRRNGAADDGVSALSPYLHHGHVSPMRIAREAAADGSKGAEKFLDELIIWRELAHHFCFHTDEATLHSLDALPDWARRTLAAHAGDEREALRTWESLARGRSGDRVWDLAQRSLLRRGWLHNNIRMTWGKAVPQWTRSPESALALLLDLNHRFALDGCDPNSYGGLLWCLGQFDRPFTPEQPVLGSVRGRDTEAHAERIDLERYRSIVSTPPAGGRLRVGVIGAGVAGLACARALADQGHVVVVFDKGRSPGGRISTRRDGDARFDHGAQYFTVRDPRFGRVVRSWLEAGVVARWRPRLGLVADGRIRPHERPPGAPPMLVGTPRMSVIAAHLAEDVEVRSGLRITAVERSGEPWRFEIDGADTHECDAVALAIPPAQAASLVNLPEATDVLSGPILAPCWACMVEFDRDLDRPFDALRFDHGPLSWAARESSKPGRPAGNQWTLHASPAWTRTHLEIGREEAAAGMLDAFARVVGRAPSPATAVAHRWRYAQVERPLGEACWFDRDLRLGFCGDWCLEPRIEGAFLSGCALAGRIGATRVKASSPEPDLFGSG